MATKIVTKNSSTGGAVPSASDLVQGELAVNVADKRLFTEDNGGSIVELGTNPSAEIVANGGIALPDSQKATFGAGDDLQIYHDGSSNSSYIKETGTGSFNIEATNLFLKREGGTESFIDCVTNGAVTAYYDGSAKLATTATGIDVTGTATMDGLTVDGTATIQDATSPSLRFLDTNAANSDFTLYSPDGNNSFRIKAGSSQSDAFAISSSGDISFYEDTGTTPKLFWDASAESLGIGTTSPTYPLHVAGEAGIEIYNASGGGDVLNFRPSLGDASKYNLSISSYDHSGGGVGPADGLSINGFDGVSIATGSSTTRQERMRIDSAGNVGIGTSSPAQKLHISDSAPFARLESTSTSYNGFTTRNDSGNFYFGIDDSGGNFYGSPYARAIYADGAYPVTFYTNAAERMRIDSSGNVGIGTSTPTAKLHLNSTSTTAIMFDSDTSTQQYELGVGYGGVGTSSFYLYDNTANATRLVINSAGNVGIGTSSPSNPLEIQHSTVGTGNGANNTLALRYNSSTLYGQHYMDANGIYHILADNSGSAGGNMQLGAYAQIRLATNNTERMRIDSSGKLLLGASSSGTIDLLQIETPASGGGHGIQIRRNDSNADQGIGRIMFGNNTDTSLASVSAKTDGATDSGALLFNTSATGGSNAERMRIDSSGNVGIGKIPNTNFGGYVLQLNGGAQTFMSFGNSTTGTTLSDGLVIGCDSGGADIYQREAQPLRFHTSNTERMRIDSSGNLLVGTTSTADTDVGGKIFNDGRMVQGFAGTGLVDMHDFYRGTAGSLTRVGNIRTNGSSTTYNTSSDQRLKENIADADDAGSKVDSIQVRKFDWKADGSHQDYGMVAQELQLVAPEAVSGDADSEDMMGVDYSKLVPMLIKEIQSLRNRVAQLEE